MLYAYSKQIIQTYDSLQNRLQEIKDIISGTIRVATIYSIGLHDLPPYLKKFLKTYPTVNVHIEYRRANQVYEDVLGNVVDVGLVAYPTRDAKLELVPLRKDTLVMICHPSHPLAKSKSIKLSQLAGQKFISFEPDIPTRKAIDKVLKDHNVQVETVMEFDNIETVKRAVEIEAGISLVPQGDGWTGHDWTNLVRTIGQDKLVLDLSLPETRRTVFRGHRPLAKVHRTGSQTRKHSKNFPSIAPNF